MTRIIRRIEEIDEPYPLKGRASLPRSYPEVAVLWDYARNCGYGPEEFSHGSGVVSWWKCNKGPDHRWPASISSMVRAFRTGNTGCPYCVHKKLSVTNSLAALRRDLAKEFMESRNKLAAKEVVAGGSKKYWWQCRRNPKHTWQVSINQRISCDTGCPKCNVGDTIDLRQFPTVLKQFDRRKNKGVDPYKLSVKQKVHWHCAKSYDHTWVSTFNRRKGERCPYCKGSRPSKTNNLALNHELAKQFHPSKNGSFKAKDYSLTSREMIWWKCPKGQDHEWEARINMRVRMRTACPFCCNRRVSSTNCLSKLFPELAKELHPTKNAKLTGHDITATSTRIVWWRCEYGHNFKQLVRRRTERGQGCRKCYLSGLR